MDSPIQIKLFIGYCNTNALKAHLHQSRTWKEAQVTPGSLLQITRQEKNYIGLYTPLPLPLKDVQAGAQSVKEALQYHCPTLDLDKQTLHIFPQVFLI